MKSPVHPELAVSLLTGGADRPYAFGLTTALMSSAAIIDLIGNDDLDCPEFRTAGVTFLNFRGDQNPNSGFVRKALRVLAYYARLNAPVPLLQPWPLYGPVPPGR